MAKWTVEPGQTFCKAGQPRVIWTVERIRRNTVPAHVVLARLDDPTTRITIALTALSNPLYFHRSIVPPHGAGPAPASMRDGAGQDRVSAVLVR